MRVDDFGELSLSLSIIISALSTIWYFDQFEIDDMACMRVGFYAKWNSAI